MKKCTTAFVYKSLFLTLCLASVQFLSAQSQTRNKISLDLFRQMQTRTDQQIPVVIQGDKEETEKAILAAGGKVKYSSGNIVTAILSPDAIRQLNTSSSVQFIDCPKGKGTVLNDVMVQQNNVDSAYYGYGPLTQGYDGTGVVVGIIDLPIDINHGDFKDADGNTRIKYLWDQTIATDATAPSPYDYGIECDSASVANGTCPHIDMIDNYSHGSGVTGIAASSGHQTGRFRGVAPNSDIVFVALDFSNDGYYLQRVMDAINYIYEKADAMHKPCVINTSFGDYTGSHDGKDLIAQFIDNKLSEKTGRALVAAAGNAGNSAIHLGYDVDSVPHFTWFKRLGYYNAVYYQLWADTTQFRNVRFSFAADNPAGFTELGNTPYYTIKHNYNIVNDGDIDSTSFTIGGAGTVQTYVQLIGSTYFMEVFITPANPSYYWRFTTKGKGRFDIWSTEAFTGYSNYVTTGLPDATTLPDIVNYKLPDYDQNIVSSWQCSDKVITVGSYSNRDTMTNYYGEIPPIYDTPGALFVSSSHGPTRDGRIKPDLCATGARVLTTGSSVLTDWLISLGAAQYISNDGQHYLQNGTSFASPVVTGIAALYLQKYPDADYAEIKNAIINNTRKDSFTGEDLPDNQWGYGKADAFRALTGPQGCAPDNYTNPPGHLAALSVSATSATMNWDNIPNANGYRLVWQKTAGPPSHKSTATTNHKVLSALEPSTEYFVKVRAKCNALGLSNWTVPVLFTTLPLKEISAEKKELLLYPDPSNGNFMIRVPENGNYALEIFSATGKCVYRNTEVIESEKEIATQNLSDGIYTIVLQNGSAEYTQQFMIIR